MLGCSTGVQDEKRRIKCNVGHLKLVKSLGLQPDFKMKPSTTGSQDSLLPLCLVSLAVQIYILVVGPNWPGKL